jgi:CRISPR-associated protein Cas2
MRNRYIVSYDVSDPKRLKTVFNIMKGYGDHLQLSVFLCELSLKEKAILLWKLEEVINHNEDSIMVAGIGSVESNTFKKLEFIGTHKIISDRKAVIV